jgi:thioredoxin-like negative regulator of GroEL
VLHDALALLAVHAGDEALRRLGKAEGLGAARVRAAVARQHGKLAEALALLRDAVDESAETDAHAADARLELAALFAAAGKAKLAARTLDEAEALPVAPAPAAVQRLRRGISLLG